MRLPGHVRQLRLEERGHEEGMAGKLHHAGLAILVRAGEGEPTVLEHGAVAGVETVVAVEAFRGLGLSVDPCRA